MIRIDIAPLFFSRQGNLDSLLTLPNIELVIVDIYRLTVERDGAIKQF